MYALLLISFKLCLNLLKTNRGRCFMKKKTIYTNGRRAHNTAELVADTEGKAKLFEAKDKVPGEFKEVSRRKFLNTIWILKPYPSLH